MQKVFLASDLADKGICTQKLQKLIDQCAENGGGQVRLTAGTYETATLELKSNVILYLDAGAIIRGVKDYTQYRNRYWEVSGKSTEGFFTTPKWWDALICAYEAENFGIEGFGLIDGNDCFCPIGEQEFRGPHGVFFYRCRNFVMHGVTILRSGNYATMYHECHEADVNGLHIYGGQDAMHTSYCSHFTVQHCDFRTGDDCVSGAENRDMYYYDCKLNTPGGHSFLMSCINLHVKHCKIWGQGEYPAAFKNDKRYSNSWSAIAMLNNTPDKETMFSDNWLFEDIEMENVETIFRHDRKLYFQDGQVGRVVIDGIRAVNFIYPITLDGKEGDRMDFTLRNGIFIRRTDDSQEDKSFLMANWFKNLTIENVTVENCCEKAISVSNGEKVIIRNMKMTAPATENTLNMDGSMTVSVETDEPSTTATRFVYDDVDSIYVPIDQDETFRGPRKWLIP